MHDCDVISNRSTVKEVHAHFLSKRISRPKAICKAAVSQEPSPLHPIKLR